MTETNRWLVASIVVVASLVALLVGCDEGPAQPQDTEPSFGAERVQDQAFTVGTAITALVLPAAAGGNAPLTYSLTPEVPGLEFLPAARMLSGTPTAAAEGVHAMTYRVEDDDGDFALLSFDVRVAPADTGPSFGGRTVADQAYTVGVQIGLLELPKASGGNPPLRATLTPEVPGLMFLPFVPALTGTPTEAAEGDHAMTYRVEDVDGDVARLTFTVRVNPASAADTEPSFGQQTVSDHTFWVGSSIVPLVLPEAGGGNPPLTYSLTPEVPGLWFNPVTRILGGTPTAVAQGTHAMTYRVADVDGDFATLMFTVRIDPADTEPSFGAERVQDQAFAVGTAIAALVLPAASGGNAPLTYSLRPDIPGLQFNARTRTLSGTPTATGVHSMAYRVVDSDGDAATLSFNVRINPRPGSVAFWTDATRGWSRISVRFDGSYIGALTKYRNEAPSCRDSSASSVVVTRAPGTYSYSAEDDSGSPSWSGEVTVTAGRCLRYRIHCGDDRDCGPDVPQNSSDGGQLGTGDTVPEIPYGDGTLNKRLGVTTLATDRQVGDAVRIEVSVRDHACEDGDRVSVQVRRATSWEEIFNGEIFNRWETRYFDATVGYHYTIVAIALNGTGFKGNCSHADINTGELFAGYNGLGRTSTWRAPGGSGSAGIINIVAR